MASPFSVFRKNQKVLMALTVGFAMIAFIAFSGLGQADVENFPMVLAALLGALALWLLSGKGGAEGWLIAAVGAVLGAVVGVYGPTLLGDNTAVYTARGNLSNQDLEGIARRQEQANMFLEAAARTVAERVEKQNAGLPANQQQPLPQPEFFGFVNPTDPASRRENVVMTYLFGKEADDLGITLGDAAVEQFIKDQTDGGLTDQDFKQIRSEMQIGTSELFDVLREQMRARQAALVLAPRSGPTPQQLWTDYKKLAAEATVTAVAVPAEAFVSAVADPSAEQLARFFDTHKQTPPAADGTPGFLMPRQVQIAYLEIPFETAKQSVAPPTDAEVLAFYERNRSRLDLDSPSDKSDTPVDRSRPPVEAPKASTAKESAASLTPSSEKSESVPATDETPTVPETPTGDDNSAVSRGGLEFVSFQEEGTTTSEPAKPTTPVTDPPTFPAGTPVPAGSAPPSEATLKAIHEDLLNQRAREFADQKLKDAREATYQLIIDTFDAVPLPEDPTDEAAQRGYEKARKDATRKVVEGMKAYAKQNDLKFATTPLMSAEELFDSDDYPIGGAIRWQENQPLFSRDTTPIVDQIFQSAPDQPLSPLAAQSPLNESRYVALKIDDAAPHVPTLDDEGIRDRVVKAWKLQEARELAKDRAEELAKTAGGDLAAAVKGQSTTGKNGRQELTAREVGPFTWLRRSTVPGQGFSLPDIVPNTLPQLPGAGEEFMQTVFETVKVGQAGVAPSEDRSTYYVVEVDKRSSEEDVAKLHEGFLKEDFWGMPMFPWASPHRMRMMQEAQELRRDWLQSFRERHKVIDAAGQSEPAA